MSLAMVNLVSPAQDSFPRIVMPSTPENTLTQPQIDGAFETGKTLDKILPKTDNVDQICRGTFPQSPTLTADCLAGAQSNKLQFQDWDKKPSVPTVNLGNEGMSLGAPVDIPQADPTPAPAAHHHSHHHAHHAHHAAAAAPAESSADALMASELTAIAGHSDGGTGAQLFAKANR